MPAWGRSSPCIVNAAIRSRIGESSIAAGVAPAGRGVDAPPCTGCPAAPCSTIPPRRNGRPASRAAATRVGVRDDRVVHQVRDGATAVAVQPVREDAEHERLEVVLRKRPTTSGLPSPVRSSRRGVSNAPAARMTWAAPRPRARRDRGRGTARPAPGVPDPSRSTSVTYDSGRISQRPVRSACGSGRDGIALGVDGTAVVRRRIRSCCTRAGRRTRRCSLRSARGTGGSRGGSPLRR